MDVRPILALLAAGAAALSLWPRRARLAVAGDAAVVTYHPQATHAGVEVLQAGGNAFDAFVAASTAEYVVAEGGTSLAGPLGVIVHDAKRREVRYLDAEFNEVRDHKGRWRPGDKPGKSILVPGAPAGLEALSQRFGRLPFSRCLAPAIRLAGDGFPLNELYSRNIELRSATLRRSRYGRRTFFRRGLSLEPGDTLRQPELASLLDHVARDGASYMYGGPWAARFVRAARSTGGLVAATDLESYRAAWRQPWRTTYRGHTLYACSGRTFGGLWTMLALKALEHADMSASGHFSKSADALEMLVRTVRQMAAEGWLLDYRLLDDDEFVCARLTSGYAGRIWRKVAKHAPPAAGRIAGSHSYHVIVMDREGNIASGTNTHESLAWGDGTFVDGVPLPASGYLPWGTRAGERRISPFAMLLGFDDQAFRFATGSFSSSILEASLQFVLNLVDYRLSAQEAATRPRLGTYPHDPSDLLTAAAVDGIHRVSFRSNWLDPRVPADVVATLERRGLAFVPDSSHGSRFSAEGEARDADILAVDTGLGSVLAQRRDGRVEGAIAPWPTPLT